MYRCDDDQLSSQVMSANSAEAQLSMNRMIEPDEPDQLTWGSDSCEKYINVIDVIKATRMIEMWLTKVTDHQMLMRIWTNQDDEVALTRSDLKVSELRDINVKRW